ncbi:AKAP7 2'5' RNA ligase-like domain-containing protein [Sporodiniella umbellata]|nr:AKAP7 2'5' RNA ligase-like domain-containing protein [Sporodiniella umbellata]
MFLKGQQDANLRQATTQYYTVDTSLHGLLIGKKGMRLKMLTKNTNTRIEIKRGIDQVMIQGEPEDIERAKLAIQRVLQPPKRPTHFLSLPISLTDFSLESLYSKMNEVEQSAFVLPANFHITLGVMSLPTRLEIEQAVHFLNEQCLCIVNSVLQEPLSVTLQNLAVMQSDPAKTHVLYVEPHDNTQSLIKLCTKIIEKMIAGGYMQKEDRPLKLHATIINTAHSKKGRMRESFDARSILQKYGNISLGKVRLDKLHLMKMGRTGPGHTYQSEGFILLK